MNVIVSPDGWRLETKQSWTSAQDLVTCQTFGPRRRIVVINTHEFI